MTRPEAGGDHGDREFLLVHGVRFMLASSQKGPTDIFFTRIGPG